MIRIVIGSGIIKEEIVDDKVVINIEKDSNLLIEKDLYKKYEINVKNANLNILVIKEDANDLEYKININKGNVSFNYVSVNSKNSKIEANLNKKESNIEIYNSVIASNKVNYDILVNHNTCDTKSNIYNNGITKEDGSIIFNVTSFAPKKAKNSTINQDSKIITLNDINENEINPILLIDSFEAEARHAAFIGNFKEKELFYLMSRGLSKKEASNLLINGLLFGQLSICFNEKEDLKKRFFM